jgi:3-oxoacyl-(acyl-carrier-protein) synthase
VKPLAITGVGVCGASPHRLRAKPVLDRLLRPSWSSGQVRSRLPPIERRRVNETSRLAIVAALQAVEHVSIAGRERLSTVFSSADGDTEVLTHLLAKLATRDIMLSPTLFHNSVFNAPAGYWSLGCKAQAASTTVCAGRASFAVGLCEASSQVLASEEAVLYIAYDMAFPEALKRLGRTTMAFACALLLEPTSGGARALAIEGWERKLKRARLTADSRRWRKGSPATPPRLRCRC